MRHSPASDQRIQCLQRFQNRSGVFVEFVLIVEQLKNIGTALWPVQLIQVDIVGLQPSETGVHGFEQIVASIADAAPCGHTASSHGPPESDRPLSSQSRYPVCGRCCADNCQCSTLRKPVRFRARWQRVHFSRVDEGYADLEPCVQLRVSLGFGNLLCPSHGAQTERAYLQSDHTSLRRTGAAGSSASPAATPPATPHTDRTGQVHCRRPGAGEP